MRCDEAREAVSAAVDGELAREVVGALDEHLAGCRACAAHRLRLEDLRRRLRVDVVGAVPDVAPAVLAEVGVGRGSRGAGRPVRWWAVAAAAVAGLLVGSTLVAGTDLGRGADVAVADLGPSVLAAQRDVGTVAVGLDVVEHGFAPDVPRRVFAGQLVYLAPERLAFGLRDFTDYPDGRWPANDVTLVVDGERWWAGGPAPCPRDALPDCLAPEPRHEAVVGREPFADDLPAPLDMVVPVRSLAVGGPVRSLGQQQLAGRPALGVRVTVAQVAPLLDGLRRAGAWRDLHPADEVELWVDRDTFLPLLVEARAAAGVDRELWAAARGYEDRPGDPLLELRVRTLTYGATLTDDDFPLPPADVGAGARSAGFRDGPAAVPSPTWLPDGMASHRTGVAGEVAVGTWTDGRAWVKVRATTAWAGGRLFGDLGDVVRRHDLPGGAGVAYVAEGGGRVAMYAGGLDVVVSGSVAPGELLRVAASLGVTGLPVPASWVEAGTATVAGARRALRGLLVPVAPADFGFGAPAVQVDRRAVTLAYAGPGERGVHVVQAPGEALTPPLEPDVRAVRVRGLAGRWSPERGRLEWVEGGVVVELRSSSLPLGELLALAGGMEASAP